MARVDNRANQFIEDKDSRVSVGIKLPFSNASRDGYFNSSKTTIAAVKNNIKMLLSTDKGERLFQPNLGVSVKEFLFQPLDEEIQIQIENSIVEALELWMPFVELLDIRMNEKNNQLNVELDFKISKSVNYLSNSENNVETVNLNFNRE
tara:strand:+ start:72 stop:518 length:447 start_codon:yes stop_codon:yes gene_type:complete